MMTMPHGRQQESACRRGEDRISGIIKQEDSISSRMPPPHTAAAVAAVEAMEVSLDLSSDMPEGGGEDRTRSSCNSTGHWSNALLFVKEEEQAPAGGGCPMSSLSLSTSPTIPGIASIFADSAAAVAAAAAAQAALSSASVGSKAYQLFGRHDRSKEIRAPAPLRKKRGRKKMIRQESQHLLGQTRERCSSSSSSSSNSSSRRLGSSRRGGTKEPHRICKEDEELHHRLPVPVAEKEEEDEYDAEMSQFFDRAQEPLSSDKGLHTHDDVDDDRGKDDHHRHHHDDDRCSSIGMACGGGRQGGGGGGGEEVPILDEEILTCFLDEA